MENWPLYFTLTKTDKLTGEALANVPFKLIDSSGNALRYTQQEDSSYKVTASGADIFPRAAISWWNRALICTPPMQK